MLFVFTVSWSLVVANLNNKGIIALVAKALCDL